MALNAIHNGRNFFSDYWLGSVLTSRKSQAFRFTPAQIRKRMARLAQLRERVDKTEPLSQTDFREKFARPLLNEILGYSILETQGDTEVRVLVNADSNGQAHGLLVALFEPDITQLDERALRKQVDAALHQHNLPYGFIVTPDVIRLVRRPGEGSKNAYFEFSIASSVEAEDTESLSIACSVLCAQNFAPVDCGHPLIEQLEADSRKHSARVSEDLKEAVFKSAEMLIRGFLDDLQRRPDEFKPEPSLSELRDAALLCLYRLLFVFYAESRDDRLQNHALYLDSYSLERMIDRLLRLRPDDIAGNRYSHWARVQALFKVYNEGLNVGNIPGLQNIPPRGGTLFSEETKDGGFLTKVKLPDDLVARLLLTLAATRPRRGVGRERVSFRELEIEQLGSVYEGLLEYEPRVADETMIEVQVAGREYVLIPSELLRLCEQKNLHLKGDADLVAGTDAEGLHPDNAEEEDLTAEDAEGAEDEELDEDEGEEEDKGVKKGAAAKLVRRLEAGDFYFVPGSARKASGSYYTREEIVQYLVRNALHDLVEGKAATEIEQLRVIDPACGSGHFLVGAARFLGKKLLDAYHRELKGKPPPDFYPSRDLDAKVLEEWEKEGEAWCKRRIVEKCLFGVDLNPTAVQLAQVALWIESLAGDRPLGFFAHHIRCGNSLVGTWIEKLRQPLSTDDEGDHEQQLDMFAHDVDQQIATALDERLLIDAPLPPEVRRDTPQEYEYKQSRLANSMGAVSSARLLFDLRNAAAFLPAIKKEWWTLLRTPGLHEYVETQIWWPDFRHVCAKQRFFHWELEFPEIFRGEKKGFDCVLGNPPWEKIKPDRKEFYGRVDILIRAYAGGELDARIKELHALHADLEAGFKDYAEQVKTLASHLKRGGDYKFCDWIIEGRSTGGDPDLFKFFLERGHQILCEGGRLGFLVPSAIYNNEGATGLRHLLLDKSRVLAFYAFENRKKIFNIHASYKFVCLVLEKSAAPAPEFKAAFMRHDIDELEIDPPAGVQVLVRRAELEKLSPGTLGFLEYRSERDREIVLKMYGLLPGMTPRPLLGDNGEGTWNARFYNEFHLTNDRDLWTKLGGKLWMPKEICGLDYPGDSSIPFSEVREAMADKGFWPLYEGKHIEQFLVNIKPIDRWVCLESAEKKNDKPPASHRKLVFRDIASNTNERTCLCAVLPECSCSGNTLGTLDVPGFTAEQAATVMNSLVFDFATRLKTAGTHLNWTYVSRVALPDPRRSAAIPPISTWDSNDIGSVTAIAEHSPAYAAIWKGNRAVAESYGLSADEFDHILSTFPVLARKRPAFFAYLQDRMKEWKAE